MTRIILFTFSAVMILSCQPKKDNQALTEAINQLLATEKGTFAVAFKDLSTGDEVLIREKVFFHAASTMKTPVMIEVYKQAGEGKFSMHDSVVIKNEFKSIVDGSPFSLDPEDDSEKALYQQLGKKRTIADLVYDMIIVSSNLATNILMEMVDARNVTQTMRDLGANDIQVLRGVEDSKAFEKGMNNTITAYDLMVIFDILAREEMVSHDASHAMTDILLDQRFNDIIPKKLPDHVTVAHKTGNITGVHHDSGIIFLPDGRSYVLVLLSKNLEDEEAAKEAMASVSELIYKHVSGS